VTTPGLAGPANAKENAGGIPNNKRQKNRIANFLNVIFLVLSHVIASRKKLIEQFPEEYQKPPTISIFFYK